MWVTTTATDNDAVENSKKFRLFTQWWRIDCASYPMPLKCRSSLFRRTLRPVSYRKPRKRKFFHWKEMEHCWVVLNSFLVVDNALRGKSHRNERVECFVGRCVCVPFTWVGGRMYFFVFSSQHDGEAFLKRFELEVCEERNANSVCLGIVCALRKEMFSSTWRRKESSRGRKSTRETLQHCMSLIALQGTIRLLSLSFFKAGAFPSWWSFFTLLVECNELEEVRSYQERWCLMWHQQTTSFMKLDGESRVLLL